MTSLCASFSNGVSELCSLQLIGYLLSPDLLTGRASDSDQGLRGDFSAAADVEQHLYIRFIFKFIPLKAASDEGYLWLYLWLESPLLEKRV